MFTEKNLTKFIIALPLIGILLTSFILTSYFIKQEEMRFKKEIIEIKSDYIQNLKDIIKTRVQNFNDIANKMSQVKYDSNINELKLMVNITLNNIQTLYQNNKTLQIEEQIKLIKNKVKNIKVKNQDVNFFIFSNQNEIIYFPNFNQFISTDLVESVFKPYYKMQKILKNNEQLLYHYTYINKQKKPEKIIIYARVFRPLNLIIGTSIKESIILNDIKKEVQSILNIIKFEQHNYLFAFDQYGTVIASHNKNEIGTNKFNKTNNGRYLTQEILRLSNKKEGGFLSYKLHDQNKFKEEKISYIKKFEPFNWAIGTGVHTDSLENKVKEKEQERKKQMEQTIEKTVMISVLLTIFMLLITLILSNKINKLFKAYKSRQRKTLELLEEKVQERTKAQDSLLSLFDYGECILFKWKNNKSWDVSYVSKSVNKVFEYTHKEFLNGDIAYKQCIHKQDIRRLKKDTIKAIKLNQNIQHEPYRIVTKSGKIKWVLEYTLFIKDEENKISHFLGYIVDITALKKSEKLLAEQSKMASLGEMIANIAHQWRQPLSSISTAASGIIIKQDNDLLEENDLKQNCKAIVEQAKFLSQTIDDFRNFLKEEKLKQRLNLKETIQKDLTILHGVLQANHIKTVLNIDKELYIVGYKNELIQALLNLITNSKDALIEKCKDEEKLIFIDCFEQNNQIIIIIKDNAKGIQESILNKIFEPYFTTKHKSIGTGLGLYMTHKIVVESSKGDIKAYNETFKYNEIEYKGAVFKITLPKEIR